MSTQEELDTRREVAQIIAGLRELPRVLQWMFIAWVKLLLWDHRARAWLIRHSGLTSG